MSRNCNSKNFQHSTFNKIKRRDDTLWMKSKRDSKVVVLMLAKARSGCMRREREPVPSYSENNIGYHATGTPTTVASPIFREIWISTPTSSSSNLERLFAFRERICIRPRSGYCETGNTRFFSPAAFRSPFTFSASRSIAWDGIRAAR